MRFSYLSLACESFSIFIEFPPQAHFPLEDQCKKKDQVKLAGRHKEKKDPKVKKGKPYNDFNTNITRIPKFTTQSDTYTVLNLMS